MIFQLATMDPGLADGLQFLGGGAATIALLTAALKWLNKDRDKILASLNEEREHRIKALEDSSRECTEDRVKIRQEAASRLEETRRELHDLQKEFRDLLRSMVTTSKEKGCGAECLRPGDPGEAE